MDIVDIWLWTKVGSLYFAWPNNGRNARWVMSLYLKYLILFMENKYFLAPNIFFKECPLTFQNHPKNCGIVQNPTSQTPPPKDQPQPMAWMMNEWWMPWPPGPQKPCRKQINKTWLLDLSPINIDILLAMCPKDPPSPPQELEQWGHMPPKF